MAECTGSRDEDIKDFLCRAIEEQEALRLEHSPVPHSWRGCCSITAGHSWIPRPCRFTPAHPSAARARQGAKREPGWGFTSPGAASAPHQVTAHRRGSCCFLHWAGCGWSCSCGGGCPSSSQIQREGSVYISAAVRSPKCSPAVQSQNELQTVWTKLFLLHLRLQSHPIKCPPATKQNGAVRCRAHAKTFLQWLVQIPSHAFVGKELPQPLARPWRRPLTFTEGKGTKLQNICLIFTNSHMGKISKNNSAKMSNWVYLICLQILSVNKKNSKK